MIVKKRYKMENLDCANCAEKMARAIEKIPGVVSAQISFMTEKLVLECEEDRLAEVLAEASMACKAIDRDAKIVVK